MAETNLTLRIPDELKASLVAASNRAYQTQSDFVLAAITHRINGACSACGRDGGAVLTQSPGMSERFEQWLRAMAPAGEQSPPVLIATQEPSGARVYTGRFTDAGIHDSYISLRPEEPGVTPTTSPDFIPIPRAYVVMWAASAPAEVLRTRLRNWGYVDVTATLIPTAAPSQPTGRSRRS